MIIGSGVRAGGGPHRLFGVALATSVERGWWAKPGALRNFGAGEAMVTGQSAKAGIPNGYTHPAAWVLPQKPGGLGSYQQASGYGVFTGSGASGFNIDSAMTGLGDIDSATADLIVQAVAALVGTGTLSGELLALLQAVSALAGAGDLAGAIDALGHGMAAFGGVGSVTTVVRAEGDMSADITLAAEALNPSSIANAVWSSPEGSFLYALGHNKVVTDPVAGTMTVYGADGTTVLYVADLWEDAAAAQAYRGQGADRRDRF